MSVWPPKGNSLLYINCPYDLWHVVVKIRQYENIYQTFCEAIKFNMFVCLFVCLMVSISPSEGNSHLSINWHLTCSSKKKAIWKLYQTFCETIKFNTCTTEEKFNIRPDVNLNHKNVDIYFSVNHEFQGTFCETINLSNCVTTGGKFNIQEVLKR